MTISDVKNLREQTPFRPFVIHLTSGAALPVQHAEMLSINPAREDIFILWVGPSWNFIDVAQIAKLSGVEVEPEGVL